jgi:3D (Asp-Asp-Asp) domain-containing protein
VTQSDRTIIPARVASSKKTSALCAPIVKAAGEVRHLAEEGKDAIGGRLARLTAYWSGEGDYYTRRHLSSTGVRLHSGHCAVDPSVIPYGSVVQIAGLGNYLAVDTGTAVVSRRAAREAGHNRGERNALVIDLYFDNRREGEAFAANGPKYAAISWAKPDGDSVIGMTNSAVREESPAAALKATRQSETAPASAKAAKLASTKPDSRKVNPLASAKAVSKHDTSDTSAISTTTNLKGGTKLSSSKTVAPAAPKVAAQEAPQAVAKPDRAEHVLLASAEESSRRKSLYQF